MTARRCLEAAARAGGGAFTVLGGDPVSAVRALGFAGSAFGHICTGGGAGLEYLEAKVRGGPRCGRDLWRRRPAFRPG